MFKVARIFILLVILCLVAVNTWLTQLRSTDWSAPLAITVYPVRGDDSEKVLQYLRRLSVNDFNGIETFLARQASDYGVALNQPVYFKVTRPLQESPPSLPESKSAIAAIFWSLKFRYWAWRMKRSSGESGADIHLFVVYHDPDRTPVLAHSVGLQKGMIGIVNAYGDWRYSGKNQVVMLHELLHTLGATDKYDLANGKPLYPHGYAEPDRQPLYPQRFAEIMGGHIPESRSESKMPKALNQVVIGATTAAEINWIQSP